MDKWHQFFQKYLSIETEALSLAKDGKSLWVSKMGGIIVIGNISVRLIMALVVHRQLHKKVPQIIYLPKQIKPSSCSKTS